MVAVEVLLVGFESYWSPVIVALLTIVAELSTVAITWSVREAPCGSEPIVQRPVVET
jgi:hypothetical protein